MNGFNYLQTVAQKYGNRYIKNSLEKGKKYSKSRHEMNCNSTNSSVSSHCVPCDQGTVDTLSIADIVLTKFESMLLCIMEMV